MARKTKSTKTHVTKKPRLQPIRSFVNSRQTQTVFGLFLILFSFFLTIAFVSFFFYWKEDQSALHAFGNNSIHVQNHLGKIGAHLSHIFHSSLR
jgi:S-DNA-T family DNA segregation ATPase FtsK/SpoIIIE